MPRLRSASRICGTAEAASSRSTVMRTISEPARDNAATWATVPSTSAVSVLVIDCTTIGAPPPTATLPTMTWVVSCRVLGPATSSCGGFTVLFMGVQISGFGDIQQWINRNRDQRAWPVDQVKSRDHQQRRGAEYGGQALVEDEIASRDAKQRGDEGKSRQFAGGIGFDQRKPYQKRQSDHPKRLIDHQRQRQRAGDPGQGFAGNPGREAENRDRQRHLVAQSLFGRGPKQRR